MALGPRGAAGLCSASRAKRHAGSGPSAQTLGRTSHDMSHRTDAANLANPRSVLLSIAVLAIPISLYAAGSGRGGRAELLFEALFYLSLASVFFGANRYSRSIAVFAMVRWLCESWATFGKQYRTRFVGALFLLAFLAALFQLAVGTRITQYFASLGST